MNNNVFKLNEIPKDLGNLIFECDDSQTMYDMSDDKRKAMFRSPAMYVLLAILAFMIGWYVYSLVSMSLREGFLTAFVSHLSGLMLLAVAGAILVISAFGLWGKFMRFAFKKDLVRAHGSDGARMRALKQEIEETDARKPVRNALSIYEDYIVVVRKGKIAAYARSAVSGVSVRSFGMDRKVVFVSESGEKAFFVVSQDNAREIRRIFNDLLIESPQYDELMKKSAENRRRDPKKARTKTKWHCDKSRGAMAGLTLFMLIPMGAGAAVIALHYYVNAQIPMFLDVFFIMGGVIGLFSVYSFIPVVHTFVMPFSFGVMLTVAPMGILGAIYSAEEIVFTFSEIFKVFTPLNAGFVFLTLMGVFAVLYSFYALYKFIRYGDSK